jgi:hypothetical protein
MPRVHRLQSIGDGAGDDEVAVPLLVGRHDVPGGVLGRAIAKGVLEGLLVGVPEGAFLYVAGGKLPSLVRVVEAGLETLFLLVFGDLQEEREDGYTAKREVTLEALIWS